MKTLNRKSPIAKDNKTLLVGGLEYTISDDERVIYYGSMWNGIEEDKDGNKYFMFRDKTRYIDK